MSKRSLIIIISIIVLATAGLIYFSLRETPVPADHSMIKPVPINAAIIIESHNIHNLSDNLLHDSNIQKTLSLIPGFAFFYDQLGVLDSLIINQPEAKTILSTATVFVSFHLTGKNNFDVLYTLGLKTSSEAGKAENFLRKIIEKKAQITETKFNGHQIRFASLKSNEQKGELNWCFTDNYLLVSSNSLLLQESLLQLKSDESLLTDKGFQRISATSGKNVQGNIYFNYNKINKLLTFGTKPELKESIEKTAFFGEWTELDISVKSKELLLSGFTYSNDSNLRYINCFAKQQAQAGTLEQIIPSNIALFANFTLSDLATFRSRLISYFDFSGQATNQKSEINRLNQDYGVNTEEIFWMLPDDEFGLAMFQNEDTQKVAEQVFIIKTKSKSEALSHLQTIKRAEDRNIKHVTKSSFTDKATGAEIYSFPIENIASLMLGNFFNSTVSRYYTFIDNYLIFAPNPSVLSHFVNANSLKSNIINEAEYQQMREKFSGKSNFFLYSAIPSSLNWFATLLSEDLCINISKYKAQLSHFQSLSIQFKNSGKPGLYSTDALLLYNSSNTEKPKTRWESHLDTLAAIKPKFVINHLTKEKEIVIQDENNTLYLLDKSGKILWQKKMNERIMSDIFQIDVLKNNKLQLIFNTASAIHIIDRNGNYLDRFPLKLPSSATNGIAVFDYEKTREYRIFVACSDKRIYLFDKQGNSLKDWSFGKTEHPVRNEIQHFRSGTKDYLVFFDKFRTYITDRKGNTRVDIKKRFIPSKRNSFIIESSGSKSEKTRLICSDSTGLVCFISLNGEIETKRTGTYSANHWFDYQDVNGDGTRDFIFSDQNKLEVFTQAGIPIFKTETETTISYKPVYYLFPGNKGKIGLVNRDISKIMLFNGDGSLYEGFPLIGKTPFTIGSLGTENKFNLIVGGTNGFIFNYEVKL